MSSVLTMAEIEVRFNGEWVLIADPETDENLNVVKGRVVYHDRDRDAFDRKSLELPGRNFAVRFIGEPVPEMEFVL